MRFYFFFTLFILIVLQSLGQIKIVPGSLTFPIRPGLYNELTGSMGEIRTNHFHAGIDIRTLRRIGLPVYCSDDGYVSRVKVGAYGYGKVIYVTHPSGFITIYAHLTNFNAQIDSIITSLQYKNESFGIDHHFIRNQLPVQRRQIIGYSGNTGSSGGPHLHYEIRDTLGRVYDPLLFKFPEIKDKTAPYFSSVFIKPLSIDSRVDHEFNFVSFKPYNIRGTENYSYAEIIPVWGEIGFSIEAYDRGDSHVGKDGYNCVEVLIDGKEVFFYRLNSFYKDLDDYINNHIDYEQYLRRRRKIQNCYFADGNIPGLFGAEPNGINGRININDTLIHQVSITIWDAYHNASVCEFKIKGALPNKQIRPATIPGQNSQLSFEIFDNTLKIEKEMGKIAHQAKLYFYDDTVIINEAYNHYATQTFLWDLRKGLPDSATVNNSTIHFNFVGAIYPDEHSEYQFENYRFEFDTESLFDTLYFRVKKTEAGIKILNKFWPLKSSMTVCLPQSDVPIKHPKTIAFVKRPYRSWGRFLGGNKQDNNFCYETKEFGEIYYEADTIPPSIRLLRKTKSGIRIVISDRLTGIYDYKATLNGKFLLMEYDYKYNVIWSKPLNGNKLEPGEFELKVWDNVGNVATYQTRIY